MVVAKTLLLLVEVDEIDGAVEASCCLHLLVLWVQPGNHYLLLIALQDVQEDLWVCLAFLLLKYTSELLWLWRTLPTDEVIL